MIPGKLKRNVNVAGDYRTTKILVGRVLSTDKLRFTATIGCMNNEVIEDVPAMLYQPGTGTGDGGYAMPDKDAQVYVCWPSEGRPFILGGAPIPGEGAESPEDEDESSDGADFRMNRPVLNDGDQMISSQDGNHIISRKGGVLEMGASQMAQRLFIPIGNIIRDICENYGIDSVGGRLGWTTRRAEEGSDQQSPTEFRLRVKEFAEGEELIDLGFGRIQDTDAQRLIGGSSGQVIARLIINDRFRLWVDKDGNLQQYVAGTSSRSHDGTVIEYGDAKWYKEVRGLFRTKAGSLSMESVRDVAVTAGRNIELAAGAKKIEKITSTHEVQTGGRIEEHNGSVDVTINGSQITKVLTGSEENIGGDKIIAAAGNVDISAAGQVQILGANSGADGDAITILTSVGQISIHDIAGKVSLSVGPLRSVPLVSLELSPTTVSGVLKTGTGVEVEVNATGTRLHTAGGEVVVDNIGTVYLGPTVAKLAAGAVVTTLTHPIDYVTGLPILGASSVRAGGVPSPVGLVDTFLSTSL